ncbi:MAG: hypothetical protein ACXVEB_10955 [Bacteroidia bacterium]
MKIILVSVIVCGIILIHSCDGVVGNIKMDGFNCDTLTFKSCFDNLYKEKILFKPDSNSIYKNDKQSKVALVLEGKDTFALGYELTYAINRKNEAMLVITHFGKNREVLEYEGNLTSEQENIVDYIYNNIILANLKKCGCSISND